MKTTRIATYSTNPSNQVSHFSEDGRTVPAKSSTSACLQNEELSSTVKDSQQTKEISSKQVHYNNYDDIFARIGFVPSVLEIPDEVYRIIIEVAESRGRPDMAGRRKMLDSLCDYCNHSIECKSCVFGTSTQAHK
ncbi:MAG: hypothetical protein ACLTNA_22080 [Bacteroides thetaiotaomicron]